MSSQQPNRRALLSGFLILFAGVLLTFYIQANVKKANDQRMTTLAMREASRIAQFADNRIDSYDSALFSIKTLVISKNFQLSRDEFKQFSNILHIDEEFSGARGFGLIWKVEPNELDRFVENAKRDNFPDYSPHQIDRNTGTQYIIRYVEPQARNQKAIGLDIASEKNRRQACDLATDEDQVRITAPITLIQEQNKRSQSFLIVLPFYDGWATPETLSQRREKVKGWVYAPLLTSEILQDAHINNQHFHVTFSDLDTPENIIFYEVTNNAKRSPEFFTQKLTLHIYGRHWQISVSCYPEFIHEQGLVSPALVIIIGLFVSVILALLSIARYNLAKQKSDLALQEASLQAIVKSSVDAIIGCNSEGKIISWNTGAENIFGFSAEEALGQDVVDLLVPDYEILLAKDKFFRAMAGEDIKSYFTTRKTKSGTLLDVLAGTAPIFNESKQVVGISKTIRDVTELKSFQRQLIELNTNLEGKIRERTRELDATKRNLEILLNAIPISVSQWTRYQTNLTSNSACQRRFARDANQLHSMHLNYLLDATCYTSIKPLIDAVLAGTPQSCEYISIQETQQRSYLAHFVPDFEGAAIVGFYYIELDITDFAEAQHQLREARFENQKLLDAINEQFPYSVTDLSGKIIEVNDQFCNISGYSREELINQTHKIINSGYHPREFWTEIWKQLCAGKTWRGEVCNHKKNGETIWLDSVISPLTDSTGKLTKFIALRSDITARKAAEKAREEMGKFLNNVVSATAQVSIIATDLDGIITLFNKGAENLLGYTAEEVVGKTSPAIIHIMDEVVARGKELSEEYGEDIQGFRVFVHKADLGIPETRRWTYVRKDGSQFPITLSASTIKDGEGKTVGYVGVALDISKTVEFENTLASVRDQLAIATEVAKLGVWTLETASQTLWWNDRTFEIFDQPMSLKEQGLNYLHWRERVHPEDIQVTETMLMAAMQGETDFDCIYRVITSQGIKFVKAAAQVERNLQGEATRVTGISLDITEQQLLEQHLIAAKEASDQATNAKSNFLANMSHEIRTPMNAVLGMLQLIKQTQLNYHQHDYINKAQSAAKSLLGILNDILDFSKIEAGKFELDPTPFSLEELLRDLSVVLAGTHKNKMVEILFELAKDLPTEIVGDRLRIQQVLVNLASNAMKFTNQGYVKISVKLLSHHQDKCELRFSVEDSGIGISDAQQLKLFQSFSQAEASTTRRYGGTGLGLVISKRLVEMMNSSLELDSQVGKGSRFSFNLVASVTNAEPMHFHPKIESKALRILAVDDNPMLLEILVNQLSTYGWQVSQAADGEAALEKIQQADSAAEPFDIVIMDWYMPKLDGIAAAKKLAEKKDIKLPVVVMLTGFEREALSKMKLHEQKLFADFIVKPATPKQIAESVWQALFGKFPIVAEEKSKPLRGLQLLVVEDNELNRQVAKELLENAGAKIELAEGGFEGVQKIIERKQVFDLVIMDLQMPDMDGLEATRRIRATGQFNYLPILAMTANVTAQDREACLNAGMNDHIGKPIDMTKLVPLILALTGRDITTELQTQPTEINATVDELLEDKNLVLNRFGRNEALYQKMLEKFPGEIKQLLEKYRTAQATNELGNAVIAMHSIKGLAATLGATALSKAAAAIEKKGKDNNWCTDLEWEDLTNKFEQTAQSLGLRVDVRLSNESGKAQVIVEDLPILSNEEKKLRTQLCEQLIINNMAVLETADKLLQKYQNIATLKELYQHIQNLEFDAALTLAETWVRDSP